MRAVYASLPWGSAVLYHSKGDYMTPDQAATLLATYQLTHSVSETARQIGVSKPTVSRHLKRAGVAVAAEPESLRLTKKRTGSGVNWVEAYSRRETALLDLVDQKMDDFRPRELIGATKIIGDARYREEHPESVRGDGAQVIVPVQIVIQSDSNV